MILWLYEKLSRWIFKGQPCGAYGGECHGKHIRICDKDRGHTDSHMYEEMPIIARPTKSKIYVFAGCYQHFEQWCRISGLTPGQHAQYIYDETALFGIDGADVTFIYYETWRQHSKSKAIDNSIRRIQASV